MNAGIDHFQRMHDPIATRLSDSLIDQTVTEARVDVLDPLPNDLARIVYLASLRDYNSGIYLHPDLSHKYDVSLAHAALHRCHCEIFSRLVGSGICEYVRQLTAYARYAGAKERQFISTWKSLKGYRATIPADALPLACELFFFNIDIALSILDYRAR